MLYIIFFYLFFILIFNFDNCYLMINYIFNFLIAINDLENEEEKLKYQIITIENFSEYLLKNFLIN